MTRGPPAQHADAATRASSDIEALQKQILKIRLDTSSPSQLTELADQPAISPRQISSSLATFRLA